MWPRLRRFSRRANRFFKGNPKHALSSRFWLEDWPTMIRVVDFLFLPWGRFHCRNSAEEDVRNETTPKEDLDKGSDGGEEKEETSL